MTLDKKSWGFDDLRTFVAKFYLPNLRTFSAIFLRLKSRIRKLIRFLDVWRWSCQVGWGRPWLMMLVARNQKSRPGPFFIDLVNLRGLQLPGCQGHIFPFWVTWTRKREWENFNARILILTCIVSRAAPESIFCPRLCWFTVNPSSWRVFCFK